MARCVLCEFDSLRGVPWFFFCRTSTFCFFPLWDFRVWIRADGRLDSTGDSGCSFAQPSDLQSCWCGRPLLPPGLSGTGDYFTIVYPWMVSLRMWAELVVCILSGLEVMLDKHCSESMVAIWNASLIGSGYDGGSPVSDQGDVGVLRLVNAFLLSQRFYRQVGVSTNLVVFFELGLSPLGGRFGPGG